MTIRKMALALVAIGGAATFADELPTLVGDGVADDTAAIQARLDTGVSCVYLPPPKKEYLISKTLKIGSFQELRLDRFTRIRLAPKSDCLMIANRSRAADGRRDRDIAITGGIWDFDNVRQSPNPFRRSWAKPPLPPVPIPKKYDPDFYMGTVMSFVHVNGLRIRNLTVRNPVTYSIQMGSVTDFNVEGIVLDFPDCNPVHSNMDGVHVDGNSHYGRISDIRGTAWDDMVALNACDGIGSPGIGPITDVTIDGIYADYSHTAVRLLSASPETPVKRVTICNVHGSFFRYSIGLTYFFWDKRFGDHGVMDDIVIENCFVSKAKQPTDLPKLFATSPIFNDGHLRIGSLTIRNVSRDEKTEAQPTIRFGICTKVDRLIVSGCKQINRLSEPITFLRNEGEPFGRLEMDEPMFVSSPGANVLTDSKRTEE